MRLLVCGDRNWYDTEFVYNFIRRLDERHPIMLLIEGEAPGADTAARLAGERLGIPVMAMPAHWEQYGRSAGPRRNREMLDQLPDLVLAFHDNISASKGTADCLRAAEQRSIPSKLIGHPREL